MLRTNLSTRPFYNERLVHVLLAGAALVVLAITAFSVFRIVTLSRHNTELSRRMSREQSEAARYASEAVAIRRTIDRDELDAVAAAASEANSLIDQRTFSWTAFFNRIESTLPPDVMLTAVRPAVRDGETRVNMTVLGRRAEDIDEFMEKLEATGAFEEIVPAQQERTEEGLYRVLIESLYTGSTEDAAAAAEAAQPPASPPAAAPATPAAPAPQGGRR
ncbi:MAG: hypothetical protein A3H96_01280 [Acidobacteria bacterium RIFCSPLOWO2_02_FULL_67_36]|nr:MAG: hypothetical protein A3H96_01280 [Acidobacteria bacterium RIFCSPLOWO2_02_FULL_67_36]OFW18682.1 MAG: hypothetical protein A3G21_25760 [Acidobacteria bacterium RIFCSPLOWO2_12_FULL_66_21]